MQIAIASGKGGTGKTTVSTSLARCADTATQYLDCDVEEPNGHIFLKPEITCSEICTVTIPEVNTEKCTACGKCKDICRYNAIVQFGETVMSFPEMCHSCLGCFRVCEHDALISATREIGILESGNASGIDFVHGHVRIGEAMGIPLLKAVKAKANPDKLVIIDAPPGTSCPFVETIKNVDYVILVTEPTPFGLYDLKLAVQVLQSFNISTGIIINRSDFGDNKVQAFCAEKGLQVLLEIPFERRIAEGYARGKNLTETAPELRIAFNDILMQLTRQSA